MIYSLNSSIDSLESVLFRISPHPTPWPDYTVAHVLSPGPSVRCYLCRMDIPLDFTVHYFISKTALCRKCCPSCNLSNIRPVPVLYRSSLAPESAVLWQVFPPQELLTDVDFFFLKKFGLRAPTPSYNISLVL